MLLNHVILRIYKDATHVYHVILVIYENVA
jgi:hypothetical protein